MKTSARVSLVILGVIVFVLIVMLWYPLKAARVVAKARACTNNIKSLNLAFSDYLKDHKTYPAKLSALYPQYVNDLNLFVCPGNPRRIRNPEEIDSRSGYVLLLPAVAPSEFDDRALLCDRRSNHLDKTGELWGGIVLFCDGRYVFRGDTRTEHDLTSKFDFPE